MSVSINEKRNKLREDIRKRCSLQSYFRKVRILYEGKNEDAIKLSSSSSSDFLSLELEKSSITSWNFELNLQDRQWSFLWVGYCSDDRTGTYFCIDVFPVWKNLPEGNSRNHLVYSLKKCTSQTLDELFSEILQFWIVGILDKTNPQQRVIILLCLYSLSLLWIALRLLRGIDLWRRL